MTENLTGLAKDISEAVKLGLALNELNGLVVLERLRYGGAVLTELREMPCMKSSQPVVRLSEIAPLLKQEASDESQSEEEPKKTKLFGKVRNMVNRLRRL
jgi:hypothetical protein